MPEQHDQPQQDSESVQRSIMRRRTTMKIIDTAVLAGYNAGIERGRLQSGIGLIVFERTREILLEKPSKPPTVIYDICWPCL